MGLLKRAPLYPFVQLVLLQSTIGLPSSALLARVQGDQRQLQRPLPPNEKNSRRFVIRCSLRNGRVTPHLLGEG